MFDDMAPKEPKAKKLSGDLDNSGEGSDNESDSDGESPTNGDDVVQIQNADLAVSEIFKHENYRHSLTTAKYIGLILLYIQRHFQYNHVIQGVYLSALIVDANGILVLLKFINQDFTNASNYLLRNDEALSILCSDILPSKKENMRKEVDFNDK
jgi:hypothetical protein